MVVVDNNKAIIINASEQQPVPPTYITTEMKYFLINGTCDYDSCGKKCLNNNQVEIMFWSFILLMMTKK